MGTAERGEAPQEPSGRGEPRLWGLSPSSWESSSSRSLPPLSTPEVWELPWLVMELQVLSLRWTPGSSGPVSRGLGSVSMPEVWELLWLAVECRDRRLCRRLPALLPLARERFSSCSMSRSKVSLM